MTIIILLSIIGFLFGFWCIQYIAVNKKKVWRTLNYNGGRMEIYQLRDMYVFDLGPNVTRKQCDDFKQTVVGITDNKKIIVVGGL